MNMRVTLLIVLLFPISAWAEVSDKVPSISFLIGQGVVFAAVAFFTARYRWWLSFVGLAWSLFMLWGTFDLMSEPFVGRALFQEQGSKYFVAAFASGFAILVSALAGGIVGWRRRHAAQ